MKDCLCHQTCQKKSVSSKEDVISRSFCIFFKHNKQTKTKQRPDEYRDTTKGSEPKTESQTNPMIIRDQSQNGPPSNGKQGRKSGLKMKRCYLITRMMSTKVKWKLQNCKIKRARLRIQQRAQQNHREDTVREKISGLKGKSGEAAQENWDTGFDKAQNQGYSR